MPSRPWQASWRLISGWVVVLTTIVFFLAPETPGQESDDPPSSKPSDPGPIFVDYATTLKQSGNEWFGQATAQELEKALLDPGLSPRRVAMLKWELCFESLKLGRIDTALSEIDQCLALLDQHESLRSQRTRFLRRASICWLRAAELANCIERHNPECCLFPLQGGGIHENKEPARRARELFLELLEISSSDLASRWLLNIVSMALGEYPEGVPEPFRIPLTTVQEPGLSPRFVDIAASLGLDASNLCGGAITDDFDQDGDLDIVTSSFDPQEPLRFYENSGALEFQEKTQELGLQPQLGGLNTIAGDFDNDRDLDILVLRGAWLKEDGQIRNSLLRNDGPKGFVDVTDEAGLGAPAMPTQAAAWADFNNDGWLDLYVGNECRIEIDGGGPYPSQLFMNLGDGTFEDMAKLMGVTNDRYAKGVTTGDYDNDGDIDLFVSNVGMNRLYRNDGPEGFTDVALESGVIKPTGRSFATWFFDYDHDGWLDLFVGAYDATLVDLTRHAMGQTYGASNPCLYRNLGDGTFDDVSQECGLDRPSLPMGANFGDVNGDGWLDIYLATGGPEFAYLMPNLLFVNVGGVFKEATTEAGLGHLQKGHGVAFGDIDNDGDQDLFHQLGGFFPSDGFTNALFQNQAASDQTFVILELQGTKSPSFGNGARVDLLVTDKEGEVRRLHRAVGSVSSFGGSPHRLEIGLGQTVRIKTLTVRWPSGSTSRFGGLSPNQRLRIIEDSPTFEALSLKGKDIGEH